MSPEQVISGLRAARANLHYIVGCLPHDEAHRSSLDQARQAIKTIDHILASPVQDPAGKELHAGAIATVSRLMDGDPAIGTPQGDALTVLAETVQAYERATLPPYGVTVTVPVNRPATPEEAEHAARIGACLPNGAMFDAFGRERVRYVRVIHDGTTCVVSPGDVADLVDPGRPDDYRIEDVYLSKEEFDALPEFNGF